MSEKPPFEIGLAPVNVGALRELRAQMAKIGAAQRHLEEGAELLALLDGDVCYFERVSSVESCKRNEILRAWLDREALRQKGAWP
jgi:hypothetical protein